MIKTLRLLIVLMLCSYSMSYGSDAHVQLQSKLNSFNMLTASFEQEAKDANNQVISNSLGSLYIKKPMQFLMHTNSPDETYLYTKEDGIYYYDTFVSQLSIYPLANLDNEPFVLLYKQDEAIWDKYEISQQQNSFILKPKTNKNLKQVSLSFNGNNISMIKLYMADGIVNTYKFSNVGFKVDPNNFKVVLQEDTEINDER